MVRAVSCVIRSAKMKILLVWLFTYCAIDTAAGRKRMLLKGSSRKPFHVTPFILDILHYHNQIRYLHGQRPLMLDERLCQNAQEWAEWIVSTSMSASAANKTAYMRFTKWAQDTYSESVFYMKFDRGTPEPADPASLAIFSETDPKNPGWYAQVANKVPPYDYNRPTYTDAQRFTLMVWKGVLFIGCGKHYGKNPTFDKNVLAVVCHYMPPGNLPVSTEALRQYVHPPVPGRKLEDYAWRNLSQEEIYVMKKPKHPILRFQMVILDFLRSMNYTRKRRWYDFLF